MIAALSLLAVAAHWSRTPRAVHRGRPAGQQPVASRMRALLAGGPQEPARIQDSYGYRAFPQVHGPAADSLGYATQVVTTELNSASENPLVDPAGHAVWHNGNFHAAYVGLALDSARAALFQTAALSAARLGTLVEPSFTGLNGFAADTPASSGIMILEYVAQSAVADLRRFASPAALGSAVLSRGVEEHAASRPSPPGPAPTRWRPTGPCWPASWPPRSGCSGCRTAPRRRAGRCGPPSTRRTRSSTRGRPTARSTPTSPRPRGFWVGMPLLAESRKMSRVMAHTRRGGRNR